MVMPLVALGKLVLAHWMCDVELTSDAAID